MLKTHMKIHKNIEECKCTASKDYKEALSEVRLLQSTIENMKNEMKTLKEYKELKTSENSPSLHVKIN